MQEAIPGLLPGHQPAGLIRLFQVLLPVGITPRVLGIFRKSAQFVTIIFGHLTSIVSHNALRLAKGCGNAPLHCTETIAVIAVGSSVHCLDKQHRHTLGRGQAVIVVRKPRERQALHESAHLPRHLTEIDGRTEHNAVSHGNIFQNGSQRILETANVRCLAFELASHTRHTPLVVKVIEPNGLYLDITICRFRTVGKLLQQLCGIHILTRTAIYDYYLFHCLVYSLLYNLYFAKIVPSVPSHFCQQKPGGGILYRTMFHRKGTCII